MSVLLQNNSAVKDTYITAVHSERRLQILDINGHGLFGSSTLKKKKKWIHLLRITSSTSNAIAVSHKVQSLRCLQFSHVRHCSAYGTFRCCLISV